MTFILLNGEQLVTKTSNIAQLLRIKFLFAIFCNFNNSNIFLSGSPAQ